MTDIIDRLQSVGGLLGTCCNDSVAPRVIGRSAGEVAVIALDAIKEIEALRRIVAKHGVDEHPPFTAVSRRAVDFVAAEDRRAEPACRTCGDTGIMPTADGVGQHCPSACAASIYARAAN